ncbi:MAG: hypothetical protein ABMB14_05395 [Myxococcota bacterium]
MVGWLAMVARAADPVPTVEDGTVVVVATVPATEDRVRGVLADSAAVATLFPDVLDETVTPDGGCLAVHRHTRGLLRPLELFSRRCPTPRGWREDLVTSGDFEAYATEWIVVAGPDGTRIEYRVKTAIDAPVPQSMITAAVKQAAVAAVGRLVDRVR